MKLAHFSVLFLFFKGVFAKAADGAFEVFGEICPRRAGGDAVVGIAEGRIVFIAAGANVFHSIFHFKCKLVFGG